MNNTINNSQGSFGRTGVYESEAYRLQKEADRFTKNFEHAKKHHMQLEDHYKAACSDLKAKTDSLAKIRPSTA